MLYLFMYNIVRPLLRIVFRPVVAGLENVPDDGPVILASNHLSFVDSVLIPLVVPRRVTFLAKAEYFEGKGLASVLGAFLSAMGHIPVPRTEQRAAVAALDVALQTLDEGNAFAIYPEGTRSEDGRLYRGHTGVGWLALNAQVNIVPVAVRDTQRIMPVGARLPRIIRPGGDVRQADRLQVLRRHAPGPGPARPGRRDHARDPGPLRPGVHRHLQRTLKGDGVGV